ncbi:MAG: response regulator [Deltaproteobacteria bacterium]|nr:response regulator [Deltaproteobacteria bacterium]
MLAYIFDPQSESATEIAKVVKAIGLETKIIHSLAELITSLMQAPPRLIISEAFIQGYDDFIVLEHIKSDPGLQRIPVIIATSHVSRENIIRARKLGASGFIGKPFDKSALVKQIKVALNIHDLKDDRSRKPQPASQVKSAGQKKLSLSAINNERLKSQIMQKIEEVPSLPTIVYKVMELVNSEKSDATDFEKIIAQDQALTARMLRMANSAYYSLSRKISTISEAVVYLGYNTIRSLVLGASTSSLFKRSLPAYGYKKEGLWLHSNIVASLSRRIAIETHLTSEGIENCYVSGLLHDIGKLILGPFAGQQTENFARLAAAGQELSLIEKELLGFSHGDIGRILLEKWKLPRNLVETVWYHHTPEESTYVPRETICVAVADAISNQFGFALEEAKTVSDDDPLIRHLERLGLSPEWPQENEEEIRQLADDVATMLDNL